MLSLAANRRLAIVAGLLLPALELLRRASQLAFWWHWIDDVLIGAALLAAAWAARARPTLARPALAGAWGIASGMGYYSFAGHVLEAGARDVSGLPGWALAAAVGAAWLIALYALASAVASRR
ncbi:MAG: hypothetical protein QOJ94_1133 [Sphingomonadales bacterium]|jgi:hypothetical protein|nr:hypothetical protein [Sphingomonadales bacterium]